MVTRADIVRVARSWIDTPFADKGRQKGRGIDCVGVPLMIAEELGLLDKQGKPLTGQSYKDYSAQPVGNLVLDIAKLHLNWKPLYQMQPGDVLIMNMPSAACHAGILASMGTFIHAYAGGPAKCFEQIFDDKWARRIVACFEFPGVTE